MQIEYLLQQLQYTQPYSLVVDLNEINLGSYLVTIKNYKKLVRKIKVHGITLMKQIFTFFPRSTSYDVEFTLVVRVWNVMNRKRYTVHFGTLPNWERGLSNWVKKYSVGENLYVELVYILAYQKFAVK